MSDIIDTIIDKEEQGSIQGAFDWYSEHLCDNLIVTGWNVFSINLIEHHITVKCTKNPATNEKLIICECSCGAKYYMVNR